MLKFVGIRICTLSFLSDKKSCLLFTDSLPVCLLISTLISKKIVDFN